MRGNQATPRHKSATPGKPCVPPTRLICFWCLGSARSRRAHAYTHTHLPYSPPPDSSWRGYERGCAAHTLHCPHDPKLGGLWAVHSPTSLPRGNPRLHNNQLTIAVPPVVSGRGGQGSDSPLIRARLCGARVPTGIVLDQEWHLPWRERGRNQLEALLVWE